MNEEVGNSFDQEQEFDPKGFATLLDMQLRHFWYLGRHRFLIHAVRTAQQRKLLPRTGLHGVDLGGGCGGWIHYLRERSPDWFDELALADSSRVALELASPILGSQISLYQVDLLNLPWRERWDVAFLLDVLEHMRDDAAALREVGQALRPGGLAFVAAPALQFFWSYNDIFSKHYRRYARSDFQTLARQTGLELVFSRYFMFFLSPLYWCTRRTGPNLATLSAEQARSFVDRAHQVPSRLLNQTLRLIFCAEAPVGIYLPFPWGTSVLGVFRRPGTTVAMGNRETSTRPQHRS